MDTFRLPQAGSLSNSAGGGGGSCIEIAMPTGAGREGCGTAQLTEAAVQQLQPVGHALEKLTADVPPESGVYCAALAQISRHLDAQPGATVAALCPRLLEQAVRGRSARLRSNAMALFAELTPRSEETIRFFVAHFCSALQPRETDRHAMLAVALVAAAAMRRLRSDAGSTASTELPGAAPVSSPTSRRPLIQEIGGSAPPTDVPVNRHAVVWQHVLAWIPLHELVVARLQDAVRKVHADDSASGVAPTRLYTAMADAALEICQTSCAAVGTPDGAAYLEQWLEIWVRTRWVLQELVSVWLTPAAAKGILGTSAGPCPALGDLLDAVIAAEDEHHSTRGASSMEWLPWLRWECPALSSTRRLQAALAASSSTLCTALLLLRAPAARRGKALASSSIRAGLLLALLDGSTLTSGDGGVDRLVQATLLGAMLEPCCSAQTDDTAMDDLVRRVEEWVVAAPTFAAATPAVAVAVELIAHNTKLMVKHITNWLDVDEAGAIGSAAQELLGQAASQALEASSCRMRRWAVQLIRQVAAPESELRCGAAGSKEIFTKIASCLTIPLLRIVSTCATGSREREEISKVLHQFPAAEVIPAILNQDHVTPAQRCAELTQFVHAIASAHGAAAVPDQSSDAFKEIAADCVASIFDVARGSIRDSNGKHEQSPPNSPAQLNNPGQIGLPEALDSTTARKVHFFKFRLSSF